MIQFLSTPLQYRDDLQGAYDSLSHLPGFILLQSTDKSRGRYDIASAYPYDNIQINASTPNKQDVLDELTKLLTPITSTSHLPFQGGAIGYVAYDLAEHLLGMKSTPQPTLNAMPLLDFGLYDWAIIADHHLKQVTLFAANRDPSTPEIIKEIALLWQKQVINSPVCLVKAAFEPLITKQEYEQSFRAIQSALHAGRSYQVNLTQPFHAGYEGDTWALYKKISKKNPVPYAAFLRCGTADILSFSPERFLLYEQGKLLTSPIKGTMGRSVDPIEDKRLRKKLARSVKNRAENVMIIDLLRNDLGKIAAPGSVVVPNLCRIQSYHSVHHLVSDIEAICRESIRPFEAFLSCFPGGSITGAPKLEAMKILNEQERFSRGVYCGSIGYFSHHGRFDTNIAIRTITARENLLHLAAGGGIVIDSRLEEEYLECYTKIAAIVAGMRYTARGHNLKF